MQTRLSDLTVYSVVKRFLELVWDVVWAMTVLVAAACVATIAFVCSLRLWEHLKQRRFDAVEWARAPDDERAWMVRDLVENVLPGKTEPEVTALLGPPGPDPGRDPHPAVWWFAGLEPRALVRWHFECVVVDFSVSAVATPDTISVHECF